MCSLTSWSRLILRHACQASVMGAWGVARSGVEWGCIVTLRLTRTDFLPGWLVTVIVVNRQGFRNEAQTPFRSLSMAAEGVGRGAFGPGPHDSGVRLSDLTADSLVA